MAINGRNYGSNEPRMTDYQYVDQNQSSKALNLGKVFGLVFLMLLATAGIAFGLGYLFFVWIFGADGQSFNESALTAMNVILIISGVSTIILTLIIQFYALRRGKGMIPLSILYVLSMGVLISSLVLFFDWRILGIALGIASLIFAILAVIGYFAKNVAPMAMVGIMFVIGGSITALFTWIFTLILPTGFNIGLLWIMDFVIFAGMLLLVGVDMYNIKRICENGEMSTNLTLYCALTLYSDFIYIFIKIVYYLAIASSRR